MRQEAEDVVRSGGEAVDATQLPRIPVDAPVTVDYCDVLMLPAECVYRSDNINDEPLANVVL